MLDVTTIERASPANIAKHITTETDRQITQAMRLYMPTAVWKSPTITMYKKRRTPEDTKQKKQTHPNMVERTHANTPAKSTKN